MRERTDTLVHWRTRTLTHWWTGAGLFLTPLLESLPPKVQTELGQSVPFPARLGHPHDFALQARGPSHRPNITRTEAVLDWWRGFLALGRALCRDSTPRATVRASKCRSVGCCAVRWLAGGRHHGEQHAEWRSDPPRWCDTNEAVSHCRHQRCCCRAVIAICFWPRHFGHATPACAPRLFAAVRFIYWHTLPCLLNYSPPCWHYTRRRKLRDKPAKRLRGNFP